MDYDYLAFLDSVGVEYLNYITHVDNLKSIIEKSGILSRNNVEELGIDANDISQNLYQKKRVENIFRLKGKNAHDFVPLYFGTHTPMLWVVCNKLSSSQNTAVIKVSLGALDKLEYFSDRNCSSYNVNLYTDLSDLEELDWDVIVYERPDSTERLKKSLKAAEVLIRDAIPITDIEQIYLHPLCKKKSEISSFLSKTNIDLIVDRNEFY